jgi:L-ascorbate metabolism protein UlaG (beta-lactamase superfamily)
MMLNVSLRRKAKQFSQLARDSVLHRRTGEYRDPILIPPDELGITFIGHSSFFLQIGGWNVLVDPNYASWLVLLKRLRRPGLRLRDLPPIDAVFITHAHMDHLHKPSLRKIALRSQRRYGRAPIAIVPRHVGDLVIDLGFSHVIEMDWWEERTLRSEQGELTVTHVPSRHWGARMLKDFHRGYGGYVLRAAGHSLYHAGDTAYFEGFKEIGERLAPEVALMPIGAYNPESYRNVHASPEDALRGFVEMRAKWFIPMHYGTFRLSREPIEEPVERLLRGADELGILDQMLVLEEGITQIFSPDRERSDQLTPQATL